MTFHIFIGSDEREEAAFQVAKNTILQHATIPVKIHKLDHRSLRKAKLFKRKWIIEADGQYVDDKDGRPFSTQFSHSRFLVPELWRQLPDANKNPLVMFVDCDFLFLKDIKELFEEVFAQKVKSEGKHPVYVTQHDYKPSKEVKMDGMSQFKYSTKLWTALMILDMEHPDNELLTPDVVNEFPGGWLHNFQWLTDPHSIGQINEKWHFVPDHSESRVNDIAAFHFSEGGPWFKKYRTCRYGNLWLKAYSDVFRSAITGVSFDTDRMLFDD